MTFHPSGILVPLITPFTDDDAVAADELERHAQTVIDNGASGIVALGTTGEASSLDRAERSLVIDVCASVCLRRAVPLIVGVGSNNTRDTLTELETLDAAAEVDAALTVVPYDVRPSEDGVVAHFEFLADRSPIPLLLYNVPYRTGQVLGADAVLRLAEHPNIVGIKQAVGTIDHDTARLIAARSEQLSILAGEDALVSPLLAMGADGAILGTANVLTREFATLYELWRSGDSERARAVGDTLVEPALALMSAPNPVAIKSALHGQGRIGTPYVRLPLLSARYSRVC